MFLTDTMVFDSASVRRTPDGYMTATARVARTGIQIYKGSEVGRPDMERVRVYRPGDSVFDDAALRSIAHKPITLDHPPQGVNSKNWKKLARGQVGSRVVRDGEFVEVPLVLMDEDAIQSVVAGTKELSLGYSTELKWGSGMTLDGQPYDAVQTAIRANHLAVVGAARGGSMLRIGDEHQTEESIMAMKSILVDGVTLEMSDTAAAVVQRALSVADAAVKKAEEERDEEKKKAKDAKAASDAALADAKKSVEAKDGEIVVLKKQVADAEMTPAKLDALVKDRQNVIDRAVKIGGTAITVDGKTLAEIKRQVVVHKLGDAAVKDMSDAAIDGAFYALTADATVTRSGVMDTARAFSTPSGNIHSSQQARDAAWEQQGKDMANAYKTKAA